MFCKRICFSKVFLKGISNLKQNSLSTKVKVHHNYCTFTNWAGMALGVGLSAQPSFLQSRRDNGKSLDKRPLGVRGSVEPLCLMAAGLRARSQTVPEPGH